MKNNIISNEINNIKNKFPNANIEETRQEIIDYLLNSKGDASATIKLFKSAFDTIEKYYGTDKEIYINIYKDPEIDDKYIWIYIKPDTQEDIDKFYLMEDEYYEGNINLFKKISRKDFWISLEIGTATRRRKKSTGH
ncbi:hypothetical protein Thena_0412 [Thermodesulfobium narugense DSM 14796]|uniref:Uncharacterized protein n=1 Tax=Thermodesulfobium narugense DSM 14796 TaxID=747365 RepID=M1E6J5_9BACT|nr:hypothetical protein [Thermodesulfobium narugense]AEE14055.1 hypothetical protein Thena_0412 [Thermodesulfobium narugense DSM 14796]